MENGTFQTKEDLGDAERVSEIILEIPSGAVFIEEEDGTKLYGISKSQTSDSINVGDVQRNLELFTNDKIYKVTKDIRFDKAVVQHLTTTSLVSNTVGITRTIAADPFVALDGGLNDGLWLNTVEGCSNVRLSIYENNINGSLIWQNTSEQEFLSGLGREIVLSF